MLSETPASYSENHAVIFSVSDAVLWSHILRSSWLYNIVYLTLVSVLRPARARTHTHTHTQRETETYWISGWWHTLRKAFPNEIEQNNVPDGLCLTVSVMSATDAGYVKASVMSAPLSQEHSAIQRGKQWHNKMSKKWKCAGAFCTLL
jgi:hypothetical protein